MDQIRDFGFFPAVSSISSQSPEDICGALISVLVGMGGRRLSEQEVERPNPVLFLVVTGGTEQAILRLWKHRRERFPKEPILLLTHPNNNSLPAALEVLARIRQEQGRGRIISADPKHPDGLKDELNRWGRHLRVMRTLQEAKVGLIGEPSDWLVASSPDPSIVRNTWGPRIDQYDLEKTVAGILSGPDNGAERAMERFRTGAAEVEEPSKAELKDAGLVYAALQSLVRANGLTALSIRCFDLVIGRRTTACYALSRLNDEGVIAGCEGDLVSTVGMLWAHEMTGQPVWMANPAQVDEANNAILLAHCTVPLSMVEKYSIRSHFESGLGVGIQGTFPRGNVTLLRIGGIGLDEMWLGEGTIEEAGMSEHLCRTQVTVRLNEPGVASSLLREPLGNHLLMLRGSHAQDLRLWWETFIRKSSKNPPSEG